MLKPAWIGRFHVAGPRDNRYLNGHSAASLWVAAQADTPEEFRARVDEALQAQGLSLTMSDSIEQANDDPTRSYEERKLLRDALRHPELVICGKFEVFEDHSGRRPALLELRTERMLLRPWQPKDREPFAKMNADRDVTCYMPFPLNRRQSDEAVDQYLAGFHQYGFDMLVAEVRSKDKLSGTFAGTMGIRIMLDVLPKLQQPAIEIMWRLNREHQGKGFATEGGRALLKLAFEDFQFSEVVGVTAVADTAGRHVMEKLGMKHMPNMEFGHPRFPSRHLFARHVVYLISNPGPSIF